MGSCKESVGGRGRSCSPSSRVSFSQALEQVRPYLFGSKESSDNRRSVPLLVDRSAPMSVRNPAIEAFSPRKRTTKISNQRVKTDFAKEGKKSLLDAVKKAQRQGRKLWDESYSVWEEHAQKHVSHKGLLVDSANVFTAKAYCTGLSHSLSYVITQQQIRSSS